MRNLSITRTKSFVACAGKMKVYIEDGETGDTDICGVRCRKLGVLKNGETATYLIGEGSAKLFVIADKMSREYSNAVCQLPAGTEDVSLTGKNRFNPAAGNPFRFDNAPEVTDGELVRRRKKGKKLGLILFAVAIIVGAVVGFCIGSGIFSSDSPKDFSAEGMTVTLTDAFRKEDAPNVTVAYGSKKVAVFAIKESDPVLKGYTVDRYANAVIDAQLSGRDVTLQHGDGLTYFEYENTADGETYHYFATCFRNGDDYWLIQFAARKTQFEDLRSEIVRYAKSVRFS